MSDSTSRFVIVLIIAAGLAGCASSLEAHAGSATAPRVESAPPPSAATVTRVEPPPPPAAPETATPETAQAAAPTAEPAVAPDDAQRYVDVVTEQGQRARGLYFNAPLARKLGARGVAKMVLGAGLDAAVIDIKDGDGRITYDTQIPDLQVAKHVLLRDAPTFIRELKAAGVYAIARIVCFSDPVMPRAFPDRAILDGRPGHEGQIWLKDKKRNTWLDPYNTKNHEMLVAIAKEAEAIGFDEIQLDYVRFPVDVATKFAVFPALNDKPRTQVLVEMLARIDEAIHIPIGADVFGVAAFNKGDSTAELGQQLDVWAKHVDVFSPMLYVYGMGTWMSHVKQGRAGMLIEQGIKELRQRIGPVPVIRPFLQAFSNRADYWNPEFITEQIRGSRVGGGDGFLFWHPASSYNMVRESMQGAGRALCPFPVETRKTARDAAYGVTDHDAAPPPAVANGAHVEKPAS